MGDDLAFLSLGLPCIVSSLQLMKKIVMKLKKSESDPSDMISAWYGCPVTKNRVTRLKKDGGALVQVLIIMINYWFSFYIHIYTNLFNYISSYYWSTRDAKLSKKWSLKTSLIP